MKVVSIASLLFLLAAPAFSESLRCAEKLPPRGGDDDIGRASFLHFQSDEEGRYTLSFKNGCRFADTEENCSSKTTVWHLQSCVQSQQGRDKTWVCSTADGESCFFARYSPDEPRGYFLKGLFEFTSFRACWLPASNGNWIDFRSSGGVAGCEQM